MAHQLYFKNGKAAMMYVDKVPWHGLGTRLECPPTSSEAISAANLDWEVAKYPVFVQYGKDSHLMKKVDRFALMPADRINNHDCPVFGVVGKDYGIVQNKDAFSFFDPIIKDNLAEYETAGALGEGERIWILAKIPEDIVIHEGDKINKYILLVNHHTGMATLQIKLTPVRVVCNNTLTMALSFGESIRIPHFPDVNKRLQFASETIKKVLDNYRTLEKQFKAMADMRFSDEDFGKYIDQVMPLPPENPFESKQRAQYRDRILDQRQICLDLFDTGHPNEPADVKHTLWGAYNSVTYFADYVLSLPDKIHVKNPSEIWDKYKSQDLSRRLQRIWFGDSAALKARAFNKAVSYLPN